MSSPGFKFIDLPTSAERLGITRNQLLQWVEEGRIKPFSGKGQQSVFRAADVDRLARESAEAAGLAAQASETAAEADEQAAGQSSGKPARVRRRDPVKLIGTRLSMDSRWAEISDEDIATWLDAIERVQFERVRKVANLSIERLRRVLEMMDAFEKAKGA
ncbi:MAG TPA: helix-turn-helix domain-containing protein [Chloroflexia bacterium]|nr:helix-turn-helix domain-containing protein [Chloroflexia bacterium]